jgi:hypothetical protein
LKRGDRGVVWLKRLVVSWLDTAYIPSGTLSSVPFPLRSSAALYSICSPDITSVLEGLQAEDGQRPVLLVTMLLLVTMMLLIRMLVRIRMLVTMMLLVTLLITMLLASHKYLCLPQTMA